MRKNVWLFFLVSLFFISGVFQIYGYSTPNPIQALCYSIPDEYNLHGKIIQTYSQTNPFPRKVLLELFTATWCGPCAVSGPFADQLSDELGPEKVILYRNQCWDDGLNTPETDARSSWYQIEGVPTLVMGGTKQSHPGKIDENRNIINGLLSEKSPFQMTMQYQDKTLKVTVRNGTSQSFNNLQLITALYESVVHYEGTNGEKEHKNVVRDFIGNEKGLSVSFSSNQTIERSLSIEYTINPSSEYYLVSFLQDTTSKEIFQAEKIQVKNTITPPPNEELPDLQVPDCKFLDIIQEYTECTISAHVLNAGNHDAKASHIKLYLSPADDWDISDDTPVNELSIPPLQAKKDVTIDFTFVFPDLGNQDYSMWMVFHVDSKDEVVESSESNLFKCEKPINILDSPKGGMPDLVVPSCNFTETIEEGNLCEITAHIMNEGKQASTACYVRLSLSPNEDWDIQDDTFIQELPVPSIQVNDKVNVMFSFSFPDMGDGEYPVWIIFFIDSREEVRESSESNLFKCEKPIQAKDASGGRDEPRDDELFPRKVLLELFTATWCGPCAVSGPFADQLSDELGPEKVILYRNQCWDDGLNTPETDARTSWYQIEGVPTLVIGGTKQSHPGKIDENRNIIKSLLSEKSPFQMTMQYQDKTLKVTIRNGTSQAFNNFQLITTLYESVVHYEGSNGEKEHKNVVRDFVGNEKGLSVSFSSNQTIERSLSIDYAINPSSEYYLVSFLQDANSKEIFQAEKIVVNSKPKPPIEEPDPDVPPNRFSLKAICLATGIELSWDTVSTAKGGYNVYRKLANEKGYPPIPLTDFPISETQFIVTKGLIVGESYCFVIKPVDNNNKEIPSIISTEICVLYKPPVEETMTVIFQVGNNQVLVNNKVFTMDVSPEITKERLFVPIRILSEVLGAKVEYNAYQKKISIQYVIKSQNKTQNVEIWVNKATGYINGYAKQIDPNDISVTPYVNNARTMIPMRFIGEAFLAKEIIWDPVLKKVKFIFVY